MEVEASRQSMDPESIRVATRRAQAALPRRRDHPGAEPGRFVLIHSGFSLNSEKVRVTLAAAGFAYTSHQAELRLYENYAPEFVSLRMMAWDKQTPLCGEGKDPEAGFDPCLIPVLVDLEADGGEGLIVVESASICEYIADLRGGGLRGRTEAERTKVAKHVTLVTETPHQELLFFGHPDPRRDRRPTFVRKMLKGGAGPFDAQLQELSRKLQEVQQPTVMRAYLAKIRKQEEKRDAATAPGGGKRRMQEAAFAKLAALLRQLETDLAASSGDWLCGAQLTLADLFWGVSLFRLVWLGNAFLFDGLPETRAYADRLFETRALLDASILYPGYMPSPYTAVFYDRHVGRAAGLAQRGKAALLGLAMSEIPPLLAAAAVAAAAAAAAWRWRRLR